MNSVQEGCSQPTGGARSRFAQLGMKKRLRHHGPWEPPRAGPRNRPPVLPWGSAGSTTTRVDDPNRTAQQRQNFGAASHLGLGRRKALAPFAFGNDLAGTTKSGI